MDRVTITLLLGVFKVLTLSGNCKSFAHPRLAFPEHSGKGCLVDGTTKVG